MERSLYFSALALGVVAWVCTLLLAPRRTSNSIQKMAEWLPTPYRVAAGIVPITGFLASFLTRPPFATGQGLGFGLVIGSVGAMLTLWGVARSWNEDAEEDVSGSRNAVSAITPFAIALVVVAVPLIWMRNMVVDALLGIALGWLASTLLLLAGINAARKVSRATGISLATGAGFVAALCAVGAVGELGGNVRVGGGLTGVPWSAPLLLMAALMVFALLLCALPSALLRQIPGANLLLRVFSPLTGETARYSAPTVARWIAAGLLFTALGTQFGHRIWGQPNIFRLLGMGVVASGLAGWILAGQARMAVNSNESRSSGWLRMALPTLVLMAAGMVAFQMLSGVGVAIMLLGAWLTMGIALVGAQESNQKAAFKANERGDALTVPSELLRLLLFGTLLLLYRLFQVRFHEDLQNVLLPDHYALLGFIVGAAVPAALAQYQVTGNREQGIGASTLNQLPRMLIAGVLLLFAPALLLMLFGTKCLLCLFFGLALATAIGDGARPESKSESTEGDDIRSVPSEWLIGLFALGIGLAVAQWTAHVLPVTLMARADKTRLLTYLTGTVALLLFAAALLNRSHRSSETLQKGGSK